MEKYSERDGKEVKPKQGDNYGKSTTGKEEYQAPYREHEEDDFQNVPQDAVMHLLVSKFVFFDERRIR